MTWYVTTAQMPGVETGSVEFEIQLTIADLRRALFAWQLRRPHPWLSGALLAIARYVIDGKGTRRTTSGTAVELAWKVLHGIDEASRAFLVLAHKHCFFVIPKHSLPVKVREEAARLLAANLRKG